MVQRWLMILFLVLLCGCASTDRMIRMSGGVLDEYSAPRKTRLRSEKYQNLSREFSSSNRISHGNVAGLNDNLINIWPFFFSSKDYWTVLWPLMDCDPYGFAFRPLYNHEGDDYSILFPLSAWNTADKHGWVTLFGWNRDGFGFVPLTWQWQKENSGGAYYTPLLIWSYDKTLLQYTPQGSGRYDVYQHWRVDELFWEFCGVLYEREAVVDRSEWEWLFDLDLNSRRDKNIWNYRFAGKKPFPADYLELNRFRKEIFAKLPRYTVKTYGFIPLWFGTFGRDGSNTQRFLLLAGSEKNRRGSSFDILGALLGKYAFEDLSSSYNSVQKREWFTSYFLLSHFSVTHRYKAEGKWLLMDKLNRLCRWGTPFNQRKPEIIDLLKKIDPALELPPLVVDDATFSIYLQELWKKYDYPVYARYAGWIVPFFRYEIDRDEASGMIIPFLTWWKFGKDFSRFSSLPLMTFINRAPDEDKTIIFSPLAYYAKETRRDRADHPVFANNRQRVQEYSCAELRDQYAACGLFYRGRFGFNVAKPGVDAEAVDTLREELSRIPGEYSRIENIRERITQQTKLNDRWQTRDEIERLKKLIRYEELKIEKEKLAKQERIYSQKVADALALARKIGFALDEKSFTDNEKADRLRKELVEKYSDLRYYEDIGNGLFFRKEKNSNGDYNWHFCHILAGGEKRGEKESTHILHLLYRYRKEGKRSEMICFPFISSVRDGEDSSTSFLWRLFSLSKKNGKRGGYIFFIPFGCEW